MKRLFVYIAGLVISTGLIPQKIADLIMWPVATRILGGSYKQKIKLKDGFYMYVGMKDTLERQILFIGRWKKNLWEPLTCKKLEEVLADDDVIIAGSHIGYLVLKASKHTSGRVHAFEPVPNLFEASKQNFLLNEDLNRRIILNNQALGEKEGSLDFYVEDIRSSFIPYSGGHQKHNNVMKVPVITIDDYAKEGGASQIGLILLDVEGYEWQVLNGATEVLKSKPDLILEVSPRILSHTDITPEKFLNRVSDMGYKISYLDQDKDYANIYAKYSKKV